MSARRDALRLLVLGAAAGLGVPAAALTQSVSPQARLSPAQTRAFRAWMVRIVEEQLVRGPSPRWHHRDCAGLVRFAVNEALSVHDAGWMRANGIRSDARLPPELDLTPAQAALRNRWVQDEGAVGHFVTAMALVQNNTRFIARDVNQGQPGDLLFYDQGDDQHLMVLMGASLAYHTGTVTPTDNGLRQVAIPNIMHWRDTRWQPTASNPNFNGVHRLSVLS